MDVKTNLLTSLPPIPARAIRRLFGSPECCHSDVPLTRRCSCAAPRVMLFDFSTELC